MAGQYSLSRNITVYDLDSAARPIFEVFTYSVNRPKITEIIFDFNAVVAAATAIPTIGIGLSASQGVSAMGTMANNPGFVLQEDGGPNNSLIIVDQWLTNPGVPTQYLRRYTPSGTAITPINFSFQFPRGLVVPISNSVSAWVAATTAASIYNFNYTIILES